MAFIKTRKKIVSSAIASSLSILAGSAIAQDQVTQLDTIQSEATADKKKSLKVDESANAKLLTSLLDTPKSVSVISQQLIQDTQVTTLADALRTVPGITLGAGEGSNPNGDRPFIRGYNSESSIYVDGIRNSTSQNRDMFAVEQVEVVKGSGSSLGGAGSVGGSINMITKEAKKGNFIQGSIEQGTDDYQRITLDGNKDFGNGIAARVAVLGHKNDKPGQSDGAEYKRAGIAPSITFGLDTPTRATLSYYYLKTDDIPDSGVPYNNPFSAPTDISISSSKDSTFNNNTALNGDGRPIDVRQGIYYGWKDRDFQKQENQIGTIKLEHDLTEDLTISNIATYSKSKNDYLWSQPDDSKGNIYQVTDSYNIDGVPNKDDKPTTITIGTAGTLTGNVLQRQNSRISDSNTFTDQLSLRGKLNTGSLIHRFNIGAEYSKQSTERTTYKGTSPSCTSTEAPKAGCVDVLNPQQYPFTGILSTEGQSTYRITTKSTSIYLLDNIEINPQWLLDLGIRWDKFDTEQITYSTTVTPLASKTDFFSYQAGLTFKPTENSAIYASFATSANPVGINAGDGDNNEAIAATSQDLDPEKARTYEIGTKWDLLNNRASLTAAIFRTEKHNTRVSVGTDIVANVGSSKVDGFELGINGNITEKWAMSAGYTYLDSKLKKAAYNATANEGNPLPNIPKNSATLWTTYQVLPQFMIGGGAFASDKVYANATNTKFVPGYVRYDLMARYNINKNVNLQLNVNNVTDKRYFVKVSSPHYTNEADGRNAVLSLNFKY